MCGTNLYWRAMSSTVPGPGGPAVPDHPAGYVLRKLPQRKHCCFWILKIIAVTLGEPPGTLSASPSRSATSPTALIFLVFFLVVLVAQVRAKRFHAPLFWAVVLGTSLVGTEISDLSNRGVGHGSAQNGSVTPGARSSSPDLVIVFLLWWRTGRPTTWRPSPAARARSVLDCDLGLEHPGTSSGDWLSDDTGLGFRNAFFVIAGSWWRSWRALPDQHQRHLLFWLAFILTRPLERPGVTR